MTDEADAGPGARADGHDRTGTADRADRPDEAEVPRDRIESVVRDVLDEELRAHEREVTMIVAAVVGGGLMLLSAFSMAGVALLAQDPLVVIAVLLALGTLLLLAGVARAGAKAR